MTSGGIPGSLEALLRNAAERETVPLPASSEEGLIFSKDGWRLYAINDLWSDEPNSDGDAVLRTPSDTYLHAIWDVADSGPPSVEFLDSPHLPLAFHISSPVRDWQQLEAEIVALLPQVALRYK